MGSVLSEAFGLPNSFMIRLVPWTGCSVGGAPCCLYIGINCWEAWGDIALLTRQEPVGEAYPATVAQEVVYVALAAATVDHDMMPPLRRLMVSR